MDRFRVNFDKAARHWILNREGGGRVVAQRLILEVDAHMGSGGVFVCEGILRAGDLVSVSDSDAVVRELRIERVSDKPRSEQTGHAALPEGFVNKGAMREWCVTFDEPSGAWHAYRQDGLALVTAKAIELGCHAITSEGALHCMAEALVDGATHRRGTIGNAQSVRLRTLIVHDQTVELPIMAALGVARTPGSLST
jgi:hypothetical protein